MTPGQLKLLLKARQSLSAAKLIMMALLLYPGVVTSQLVVVAQIREWWAVPTLLLTAPLRYW